MADEPEAKQADSADAKLKECRVMRSAHRTPEPMED
jgi:hypothetical protein